MPLMNLAAAVLVAFVALEHLWFLVLEMFLWTTPTGLATFHNTQAQADTCARLAMNQGLYNGFLAAALIAALVMKSASLRRFGLASVVVAGVFGAATANVQILFVQALPGVLALVLTEVAAAKRANKAISG